MGEWTDERDAALMERLNDPMGSAVWAISSYETIDAVLRDLRAAWLAERAEAERLRASGCARNQGLTQFCAEAVALQGQLAEAATAYEAVLLREQRANARVAELEAVLAEPTTQAAADALGEAMRLEWCRVERIERTTESTWASFARATLAVLRGRAGVTRG